MVIRNKNAPVDDRSAAAEQFARGGGDPKVAYRGKATIVRRVAVAGDPRVTQVPKFDCGQGLKQSIFLDLDDAKILALAATLAKTRFSVKGATDAGARAVVAEVLDAFNAKEGTDYQLFDPCNMPGHISTGAGGCKPGVGSTFALAAGSPPSALFGKLHSGAAIFGYGYCISVRFDR